MKVNSFDYELPPELIAQRPASPRDASRLLVVDRATGTLYDKQFVDLAEYLLPGDVLVVNNTRVRQSRLHGRKPTGGAVEILLLEKLDETLWQALVGGRRVSSGTTILINDHQGQSIGLRAEIVDEGPESLRIVRFDRPIDALLPEIGQTPLPPYIRESLEDPDRYQTIYSRPLGSAAAPTAGLHFTPDTLLELREKGILLEQCTLHVGLDTFKPVTAENVNDHVIHSEWASLDTSTARRINEAKLAGGRLIAAGTTTTRVLETAALRSSGITGSLQTISQTDSAGETTNICPWKPVAAFEGPTDLFIRPGYRYRAVDMLLTNFHLPRSSLLMLVSAFAGQETIQRAYQHAIAEAYRFYSFGDAMLII